MADNDLSRANATHWRLFLSTLSALGVLQGAAFLFLFAESPISAYAFQPLANPDLTGPYVSNDELTRARLLPVRPPEAGTLDQVRYRGVAPESLAQGPDGRLYTGLCDSGLDARPEEPEPCRLEGDTQGWVVRFDPKNPRKVERYVQTGGRPLGLAFDNRGRLYIADARKGLLRVETRLSPGNLPPRDPLEEVNAPFHSALQVATCSRDDSHPDPFPDYADSVTIADDGAVWFTCPSQRHPLSEVRREGLESRPTGRVAVYEPCSEHDALHCPKQVVADDFIFANGIAHLAGENAVLVSEWGRYRIVRLEYDARHVVTNRRVFFDNTPGYPDNITVSNDTIWVGLVIRRNPIVDRFRPYPVLEGALARLPESLIHFTRHAFVLGFDRQGKLKYNLQDTTGQFNQATGAYPFGAALYITSNTDPNLACLRVPGVPGGDNPCASPKPPQPPKSSELTSAVTPAAPAAVQESAAP